MSDPARPVRLEELLRRCVQCGLCLPHCATYLATGNEAHSPRGRLLLLGEVTAGALPAEDPDVVAACGTCLGCLACTTVCPSGIAPELIARVQAAGAAPAPAGRPDPVALLDRPGVLRTLRRLAGPARAGLRRLLGRRWRGRLARAWPPWPRLGRLLGSLPADPGDDAALVRALDRLVIRRGGAATWPPAPGPDAAAEPDAGAEPGAAADRRPVAPAGGPRVGLFTGCADAALLPRTALRLRGLLAALGCEVTIPAGQTCCGAQAEHRQDHRRAASLQARNLAALAPDAAPADHLVVMAAGCGHELSRYPAAVSDRLIDAAALLARLVTGPLGSVPLRVALHDPCHARHGQHQVAAPRQLLGRIPDLQLLEPDEAEVCCGAAGTYGLRHAALSATMGARKAGVLAATGCDLVVTTNVGCLGQLADALARRDRPVPILPLSDLVWYAWRRHGAGKDP